MDLHDDAMEMLATTSRTFFVPISRLPPTLREAVASAYLCLRAIDEIEDHPQLSSDKKAELLRMISTLLQGIDGASPAELFPQRLKRYEGLVPEVTLRIGDWLMLSPDTVAPRIYDVTAAMADRMARWADNRWEIRSEIDLNRYTFGVAGAVGLLLSELWAWYDGTKTNRVYAVGFGRGLQAVNIVRNQSEDLARGVDFFPDGWTAEQMHAYARRHLALADAYVDELPPGPALDFCTIPLKLAYATLDAIERGEPKLSRSAVLQLTGQIASP